MPSNTGNHQLQLFPLFTLELRSPQVKVIVLFLLHPGHVSSITS